MTTCPPKPMPPGYFARLSECDKAVIYEEALLALSSSQTVAEIRHGEHYVKYSFGSIAYLERALARARAICGKRSAITIERTPMGYPMHNRNRFNGRL